MKGTAREVVGNDAYLVLTGAALDAMDGDSEALGLISHVEHLDVGDTAVFIENLQVRWETEESRTHRVVSPKEALGSFFHILPGTPRQLWPWFTDPRKRLEWQEGLTSIDEFVEGRRGVGAMSHCAHGGSVSVQQVLDWQPFETFTTRDEIEHDGPVLTSTTVFTPSEGGTNVTFYYRCEPELAWAELKEILFPTFERANQRLEEVLSAEAGTT